MHTKFLCTEKFKLSFCCFVMSSWFCFIFYLDQGLTNFFYTGPDIEYFRLVDHTISATKTKICQYSKNIQLIHQPQSASRPMRRCGLFPSQFAGPHHPRSHSSALHGSLLTTFPLKWHSPPTLFQTPSTDMIWVGWDPSTVYHYFSSSGSSQIPMPSPLFPFISLEATHTLGPHPLFGPWHN